MPQLSASNIAWPTDLDAPAFGLLASLGIHGLEIAPTRIWPDWSGIDAASISTLLETLARAGLTLTSLQSILFQKPGLQLFGDAYSRAALAEHLIFCAGLAAKLGAGPLVFGSPKNRLRGAFSEAEAFDSAITFFQPVARRFAELGVTLCIEANPPQYGCDFITRSSDAARLVRAIDTPGLALHLDVACTELAGEDIATLIHRNADILRHFHVSEPNLGGFDSPVGNHAAAAAALRAIDYTGHITLEMRSQESALPTLHTAATFLAETYGSPAP